MKIIGVLTLNQNLLKRLNRHIDLRIVAITFNENILKTIEFLQIFISGILKTCFN
jgi:hypothetical protein